MAAGGDVQLLRTCQQILQPTDQGDDPRLQIGRIGVEQAHRQALLPGMVALFGDSAEQPRATGDRLVMLPRRDQPIIQRPPVILESGGFGGGFGLGGEASALDALEVEALAEE